MNETYRIWSKEFDVNLETNTVKLPGDVTVRLDDFFALMYLLLLKGTNEIIGEHLVKGKQRYLELFSFLPKNSPFLAMKEDKLVEMEEEFLKKLMKGAGEYR